MLCPNCKPRGFEFEMVREDRCGTEYPIVCESPEFRKERTHVSAEYSCPNCLTEFEWRPGLGLREIER